MKLSGNQSAQHAFLWDMAPGETLYIGGLGSGKSWAGARKLLLLHQRNRCQGLAVAPTYGDLHRFVIPALIGALQEWRWPFKDRSSAEVPSIVVGGIPILLMSAEDPSRFAGFEVGHLWGDEAARYTASKENPLRNAALQIRSRLRHPAVTLHHRLHALFTTTPEGMDTWVQRDFFDKPIPTRRVYIGSTTKNAALPQDYVQGLLASLPPELVAQYMEGMAVALGGPRAHPGFSRSGNVRAFEWDQRLPVHLGADYNVDPMAWVLCQKVGDELRVGDEIFMRGGVTVDAAIYHCHDKGWGKFVVNMHPDKSAKARSTVGDPEFLVMQRTASALGWKHTGNAAGANPPVASRISNLSRVILDATGRRRLVVHPRCTRLIEEMERVGRLQSGQYDPGPDGDRGHILDALGYVAWDTCAPLPRAGAVAVP